MNISLRKINNEIQSHDLATAASKSFVKTHSLKKKKTMVNSQAIQATDLFHAKFRTETNSSQS